MEKVQLGRTGLMVTRTSFGALPLQRVDFKTARNILRRAYEAGINFYDTASGYSDSEEKIGYSLSDVRHDIVISTKCSGAKNKKDVLEKLEHSLKSLRTDYIDILQLHNPRELPDPDDPESTYAGIIEAQKKGLVRFIGITNHARNTAAMAIASGLYDTLQFPLCAISDEEDFKLAERCQELNIGFIAMKALCGGLLKNAKIAFSALYPFTYIIPIWGFQKREELEELLELDKTPPKLDQKMIKAIASEKKTLAGNFCRACGYCLPCPAEIPIPMAARMGLLLQRMPTLKFKSEEWQIKMRKINDCTNCGECKKKCPYGLDIPGLLTKHLKIYQKWLDSVLQQ